MAEDRKQRMETFTVSGDMAGKRLDVVISAAFDEYSRSFIQKLLEGGSVMVNGQVCTEKKRRALEGDAVSMSVPEPEKIEVKEEDIPLDIVYEDDELLVVDKPAGMVVRSGARQLFRDSCQCADVSLWRQPFVHQWRHTARDSAQDR